MPGHHRVRFAEKNNTFHSPPPHPPPPPLMAAGTSSSSASSGGPLTPPPMSSARLPGPTPFRRHPLADGSIAWVGRAHDYIAQPTSSGSKSMLKYDVSKHPSTLSARRVGLTSAALQESAVFPPQPYLSLITPRLRWAIGVPASNGSYVTVFDVLNGIYHALRVNATQAEFNALGSSKLMRRATAEYERRYERLEGRRGYSEEKRGGLKRVDFLMGYTSLLGISPTKGAPDIWQLHTG
ncbi:hypothetical protein FB45DRAFT_911345 [Roridomyces roridus]|uniref:DUF6699 domain-containing protein n=1 Tax=Roridomyces roridus TaxID=1738132 RepID=A0AAD7C032_9AGAR|nr:hypothetical protein FB45DRAFT_911345 [Roridomyces roridus]